MQNLSPRSHTGSPLVATGKMFCFPSVRQVRHSLPLLGEVVWEPASTNRVFQSAVVLHGSERTLTVETFLCGSEETTPTTQLSAFFELPENS